MKIICLKLISTFVAVVVAVAGYSQKSFSLETARSYAAQNNPAVKIAQKNYEISKSQYTQALSFGLPQIIGSLGYNFNVQPQVFLLPDFQNPGSGEFVRLEASPPTTFSAGLSGSMILLDGSYIMGIKAGQTFKLYSADQQKNEELKVKHAVTQAYYQVIFLKENIKVLENTITNLEQIKKETDAYIKEGFRENLDGEQIKLSVDITKNTLIKTRTQAEMAERGLKLQMGYPVNEPIELTDDFSTLKSDVAEDYILNAQNGQFDVKQNMNVRLIERLAMLNKQNRDLEMSKSFPSLRVFANYSYNGFSNDKKQPVLFGSNNTFYNGGTLVGFSLNVPIFSSLNRYSAFKKAGLEWKKTEIQKSQVEEGLKAQYENTIANYKNTWATLQNDIGNLALAEKIRSTNRIKFQEGLINSFELTNAESQYLQALSAYYNTLYTLLLHKLEFDLITNRL